MKTTEQEPVRIWTDGSGLRDARQKSLRGGFGFVAIYKDKRIEGQGWADDCTNNAAELSAILAALLTVKPLGISLQIFSDSEYCIKAITQWLPKWKVSDWMTSSCKPVSNKTLLEAIELAAGAHEEVGGSINYTHVRGHVGITENERADYLAGEARKEAAISRIRKEHMNIIHEAIRQDNELWKTTQTN